MKPHFYNLRSRLGTINLPYRQTESNVGVEYGGDAVLSHFRGVSGVWKILDVFDFPKPEDINDKDYYKVIAEYSSKAVSLIEKTIKSDETQVVIGGDHSVSFPSIIALMRRVDSKEIAHIQVDSHVDLNTVASSPTGNFHGMWMRPFVDGFEHEEINKLVAGKLSDDQICYVGNLDLDPEERRLCDERKYLRVNAEMLRNKKKESLEKIGLFISSHKHLHFNLDIDVFDSSIVAATGIPTPNGLFRDDLKEIFALVSEKKSKSIDLVEVNPDKKGAETTIELAQNIISACFANNS